MSINILNSVQLGDLVVPGSYVYEAPPTPTSPTGAATNVLGAVGTASYGKTNTPTPLTTYGGRASAAATVTSYFGRATNDNRSLVDAILNGAAPEANVFQIVRVTDGTDTAATFAVVDNTGFAAGSVASGGTWATNKLLTVTINGVASTYTTGTNGDTTIATALPFLAAAINASAAVVGPAAVVAPVVASATAIAITALASGTGGNAITLTASGVTLTLTASGATLTGGAAAGVLATLTALCTGSAANATSSQFVGGRIDYKSASNSTSPTFRATLTAFNGTVEVFDNIAGYATAGSGFSATAFMANLLTAINTGSRLRAPSQFWAATVGTSTAAPLVGTKLSAAGGTDGAAGVTIATEFGVDGAVGRTGLYALRNLLSGGTVILAGMGNSLTDAVYVQTLDAFCMSETCIGIFSGGPAGTSPATAAANLAANNGFTQFTIPVLGEPQFVDPNSNLAGLENPCGAAAGLVSSLTPWTSPLNKPKIGIVATEWSIGQFPDETVLQSNNIGYFKFLGGQWVFFGKTMGNGAPIEDTRMLNYIAPVIEAIGNTFVGQSQPAVVPNSVMNLYASDIKSFLRPMAAFDSTGQPTGNANPRITSYSVDLSPNTPTTITQHTLLASIAVQTLSSIWYVLNIIQVGNSVQVQYQPAA